MKDLIQLPAEFDYNLLLHALRGYKKPRDKIRGLIKNKDILRVKKGLYVLGKEYNKPYNKYILANQVYGPSYITGQTALAFWNMIPERVELIISMTTKRKKLFETPVGRFSYLYCHKRVFNIGIKLEDTGDQKRILIASPEKALSDIIATQTHISSEKEMKEFLELMRLDYGDIKKLDLSLLEEIKTGYKRQSMKLLLNCLKEDYV
jgi:predicted transcriptional regulator of viral defense system